MLDGSRRLAVSKDQSELVLTVLTRVTDRYVASTLIAFVFAPHELVLSGDGWSLLTLQT
jgi:hypothetical protein